MSITMNDNTSQQQANTHNNSYPPIASYILADDISTQQQRIQPTNQQSQQHLTGQYVILEPLNADKHTNDIYNAIYNNMSTHFNYLSYGPFNSVDQLYDWIYNITIGSTKHIYNCLLYAIIIDNKAVGFIGYLRVTPHHGSIEIGHVNYSSVISNTVVATEVIYLLIRYAIEVLHYRRCEWKCNSLNVKSYNAALRYGFAYEGIFKHAEVSKQYNRDTAWFSITDDEWLVIKYEYNRYLNSNNFDENGKQFSRLDGYNVQPRNKDNDINQKQHHSVHSKAR